MIFRTAIVFIFFYLSSAFSSQHISSFAIDKIKPKDQVGVFIGTFDPLTKGHESVINDALNKGVVNKVILIPNRAPYWKPNATPLNQRSEMLNIRFANSEDVLVYSGHSYWMPASIELAIRLRKAFGKSIKLSGIYGGDSLQSKGKFILEHLLIPFYDDILIFDREEKGKNGFPKRIATRPVRVLLNPIGSDSSTAIRSILEQHPEFYLSEAEIESELMKRVDPSILQYIKQSKLYFKSKQSGNQCRDFYYL